MLMDARARNWAHKPKVAGSNPAPTTNSSNKKRQVIGLAFVLLTGLPNFLLITKAQLSGKLVQ
jgi:hypothetical protein